MPRSDKLKQEAGTKSAQEAPAKPTAKPKGKQSSRTKAAPPAPVEVEAPKGPVVPRLLERYRKEILPALLKEGGYKNAMEVPRLEKVVLNIGLGEALQNAKAIESAVKDLTAITGQKPVVTRARVSIAAFKLRQGSPIGVAVTLRGYRMYDFLDRLLNIALPRIRDFHGVSRTSFDQRGNYSLGLREQVLFPEIDYSQIDRIRGLQINIITTARKNAEAMRMLELMGMPFSRN